MPPHGESVGCAMTVATDVGSDFRQVGSHGHAKIKRTHDEGAKETSKGAREIKQ